MSNIDKQALRQTAEKAQEHGVFNMDMHSQTVLALLDELEAAEKRIAELEAREVKLPELCVGVVQGGHAVMVPYAAGHWFNKTAILEMLADAGINIAAAGKGEAS